MNKGRIHVDLGKFLRWSWNLIKSNDKLNWKIRDFSIFLKRRLQDKSTELKIT